MFVWPWLVQYWYQHSPAPPSHGWSWLQSDISTPGHTSNTDLVTITILLSTYHREQLREAGSEYRSFISWSALLEVMLTSSSSWLLFKVIFSKHSSVTSSASSREICLVWSEDQFLFTISLADSDLVGGGVAWTPQLYNNPDVAALLVVLDNLMLHLLPLLFTTHAARLSVRHQTAGGGIRENSTIKL